jgi:NADP-dependent 3-hydroxy acid dehydrogenase YdfG
MSKVVIVTGAGKRFGKALAIGLSRNGYSVVATGQSEQELAELSERLQGNYMTQRCDITNLDDCRQLLADVKAKFGRIDALINNAGVYEPLSLKDVSVEKLRQVIDVVFTGTAQLSKLVLEVMAEQKSGQIVSMLDAVYKSGLPAYDHAHPRSVDLAGKFAKASFTEVLRREASNYGVVVTSFFLHRMASDIDIDDSTAAPTGSSHPTEGVKKMIEALENGLEEVDLKTS